jgi:hypothetical protein
MADRSEAVTLDTDQLTALHRHGRARFDQPRAGLNGLVVPNDFAKLDTVRNASQPFCWVLMVCGRLVTDTPPCDEPWLREVYNITLELT